MKFTLSWLKDHLDTKASLEEILDKLTLIGLEVEEVVNPGETLKDFVVGHIIKTEPHPDADKLKLCHVDIGEKENPRVVCGAPNARKGLTGVFAAEGTYIPGGGFTLGKAKIRGVESSGMLCSESELELSDDHDGIIELPKSAMKKLGKPYVEVMGLDDPMIDIYITPNRPDCLGVRGVARDLAAAGLGKLKPASASNAKPYSEKGLKACPTKIELKFPKAKSTACPAFAGRVISGLKNGPSPDWMQARLNAIGLRPINALVDITNYISYDQGRPLHVYDVGKLKGTILARLGKKGEKLAGLDGREYELGPEMTVIADDNGALGLGGVMGGEESGSTDETTAVFIESAYFDPIRTAITGRTTGIISDARFRFERGIDPMSIMPGLDQATELILEICGGTPSKATMAGKSPELKKEIKFDTNRVERLTGLKLKSSEVKKVLKDLGFKIDGKGDKVKVTPPTWRPDIDGDADLVEEVIRIVGIDRVTPEPLPRATGVARAVLKPVQLRSRRARRILAGRGLTEAITYSFINRDQAKLFGGGSDQLELANPMSTEMSSMRPSLLPGLLDAAGRNADRGSQDVALFELGQAYRGTKPEDQYLAASGLRTQSAGLIGGGRHWDSKTRDVDLYEVKADASAVLEALGLDVQKVQITRDASAWFHPGRSGVIRLGPKIILAEFGELHPSILKAMDVEGNVVGFEVFLDNLPKPRRKATATKAAVELSDLQSLTRDFAFIVERDVPAGDLIRAARGADKALISDAIIFDIFESDALGENKKSLGLEVTLQPREKTLTDEEIEAVAVRIVAGVKKATGGELRT